MTAQAHFVLPPDERSSRRLWLAAALVAISLHAGLFYWLSRRTVSPDAGGAPESAILIELPPMGVAEPPAAEAPPLPQEAEPEPQPEPQAQSEPQPEPPPQAEPVPDLAPAPKADAVLALPEKSAEPKAPPKPKIEEKPKPKKAPPPKPKTEAKQERAPHAARTTAPATRAGGPSGQAAGQAAPGVSSMSAGAWRGLVSAQLNRNKRYPPGAQGASGTASISFTIDRSGHLVSARLVGSSGSAALDSEAVAIARRASPFPPPPPEIAGGHVTLTVPVNFR